MNNIITFFKNWFEKNGLIKILAAIIILIISALVINNTNSFFWTNVFNFTGIAAICYLILTVIVFLIAGIINSIKK